MAHPGRCDRPPWIGFGGKSKRRNFLTMDGPDLREQVVVGEGLLVLRSWAWTLAGTLRRKFERRYPLTPAAAHLQRDPALPEGPIILVLNKHTRRKLGISRRVDLVRLVPSAGALPDSRPLR